MKTPQPHQVGVEFLSWINAELRKEIDRQETQERREKNGFVERMKTYLVAGISSASMIVLSLWS